MSELLKAYETGLMPINPTTPKVQWCPWNPTEQEAIWAAYFAARGCYYSSEAPIGQRYGELWDAEKDDVERQLQLIKRVLNKKHRTVLTHINFSFWVEGVPQKIMVQLIRQQVGTTFDIQSSRFSKIRPISNKEEITGLGVVPIRHRKVGAGTRIFLNHYRDAIETYHRLIDEHGFTPEEASYVLCLGHFTSGQMSYNLVSLQHLWRIRVAGTTGKPQPEATEAAEAICNCFAAHCPQLAEMLFQ